MTVLTKSIEPEVSSASPEYMSNEELLAQVQGLFQKIADGLPYIVELRARFARRKRGQAHICGCSSWQQFCLVHLHRTDRRIRQVIAAHALSLARNTPQRQSATKTAKRTGTPFGFCLPQGMMAEIETIAAIEHKSAQAAVIEALGDWIKKKRLEYLKEGTMTEKEVELAFRIAIDHFNKKLTVFSKPFDEKESGGEAYVPLTIPCPKCGARVGVPCRDYGKKFYLCGERIEAARPGKPEETSQ